MTKFKLNISKLNGHIDSFSRSLQRYDELSDNIYANVKSSDNVWIDPASMGFNTIVRQDESNLKNIKISLKKYHDNILYFSQELGNIFISRGYSLTRMSVYYDSSYVDICIDKLNNVSSLLQNTLNEFGSCIVPEDFEYLSNINSVYNKTSNISNNISSLRKDLSQLRSDIDTLVTDTIKKNSNIELVSSNDHVTHFNWSIIPFSQRNKSTLVKENKYNILQNNIHTANYKSTLKNEASPINVSSDTIITNFDTSIDMIDTDNIEVIDNRQEIVNYMPSNYESYDNIEVIDNRQEIVNHMPDNYESHDNIDINNTVIESYITDNNLSLSDEQSLNIEPEKTNDISVNILESESHKLENNNVSTNIENINLNDKIESDMKLTSVDTKSNVLPN